MDVDETTKINRGANTTQPRMILPLTAVLFSARDKAAAERFANDLANDWQDARGGVHNDLLFKISPSRRVIYMLTRGQFLFLEVNFDNNSSSSTE